MSGATAKTGRIGQRRGMDDGPTQKNLALLLMRIGERGRGECGCAEDGLGEWGYADR